jgi:hypothetical protein
MFAPAVVAPEESKIVPARAPVEDVCAKLVFTHIHSRLMNTAVTAKVEFRWSFICPPLKPIIAATLYQDPKVCQANFIGILLVRYNIEVASSPHAESLLLDRASAVVGYQSTGTDEPIRNRDRQQEQRERGDSVLQAPNEEGDYRDPEQGSNSKQRRIRVKTQTRRQASDTQWAQSAPKRKVRQQYMTIQKRKTFPRPQLRRAPEKPGSDYKWREESQRKSRAPYSPSSDMSRKSLLYAGDMHLTEALDL